MNIGDKYESYVGKELFNIIMNMFPCLSDKKERIITYQDFLMVDTAVFILHSDILKNMEL